MARLVGRDAASLIGPIHRLVFSDVLIEVYQLRRTTEKGPTA